MSDLTVKVYVSWGLWVARCVRPDCIGAEHYGHAPITGVVGGLTRHGFRCAACGLVCRAEWPANAEDIMFVLAQRPMSHTRNWNLGETLEDLIVENVVHGIPLPGITKGLTIVDGKFTDRQLVAAGPRFAIGA